MCSMHIIIIGAGEVGFHIAKFLSGEAADVVVIDQDKNKLRRITDELDVAVLAGEGGSPALLKEAGADKADMMIAVTNSDETNMIACMVGKAIFNIPRKIARLRNQEYLKNTVILNSDNLDINPAISPELEVADVVVRLIEIPSAAEVEDFENGLIKVIGFRVYSNSPLKDKSLKKIRKTLSKPFLIGAVLRIPDVIIPTGDTIIRENDIVYVPVRKEDLTDTLSILGADHRPAKNIMIVGGGRIGFSVAKKMEAQPGRTIKIIDRGEERCRFLTNQLSSTIILNGDGSDQNLLVEENIADMDVFLALSNNEELNIMSSLLAKKLGVKKVITLVNRTDYVDLVSSLGIDSVLSPRLITASTILRYTRHGDIKSLTAIADNKAEIIEAAINSSSSLCHKTLAKAKLPRHSLIGAIIRNGATSIPTGQDVIEEGDRLIFFGTTSAIRSLGKFLT